MQDYVNRPRPGPGPGLGPPTTPSSSTPPRLVNVNSIRAACESDLDAIIEVETMSFPHVYADAGELARRRRLELAISYPCFRILVASSVVGRKHNAIHGILILESYLHASREYRPTGTETGTGEGIALTANRPPDRKPANDILMAATRVDPALLDEEYLYVSEICIHPCERKRGNGTKLMRHVVDISAEMAVRVIVLVEGSVADAARQWTRDEGEQVCTCELAALMENEKPTMMSFYEDKLGFKKRSHFFWGRRGFAIPRIFYVMQYAPRI